METKDKTIIFPEIAHADLKRLSKDQLQEQLNAYLARCDNLRCQQLTQELLHELQVHQIELEAQNRDLKESQKELEEARDRYADLYDFAPVSYITFDTTGCIREINLTGAAMFGMERARLLGTPLNLWLTKESSREFFRHLTDVFGGMSVVTRELRLQFQNGKSMDVRLETIATNEEFGGKAACRSILIDISARKHAERELEHRAHQMSLITDAVPAFIAYVDRYERYRFVNRQYEDWFGRPRHEILGSTVKELFGEQNYLKIAEFVRAALAGRQTNFEVTLTKYDGAKWDVNASYIPDIDTNGTVLGYFTLVQDVTDIRRHELVDKMHMLEAARVTRINTMGEMVAELAHELNQPLAAISIYSDAVRRMLDKDMANVTEMQRALNEIRIQASRAGEVISRLREFVSKREIHNEQIQINSIINEVMNLIAVEASWHAVVLQLEFGEEISLIMADRILIEQVILNLVRNSIEAMDAIEKGKRCVTIRTSSGAHNEVIVTVEDTGPGLSVAEIENIFEPFYTTKAQGMGMGLSISRSIIKAHHGRLWAIPNDNGGTSFTFTLPYLNQDNEKEEG